MVDKLQEMGYLTRMSAAKDRRKIMVAITQEGRELVDRMRQNIVRDLAALMASTDHEARQAIADTGQVHQKTPPGLKTGAGPFSFPLPASHAGGR